MYFSSSTCKLLHVQWSDLQLHGHDTHALGLTANINTETVELPSNTTFKNIKNVYKYKQTFWKEYDCLRKPDRKLETVYLNLCIVKFCQFLWNIWCRPLLKDRVIATLLFWPCLKIYIKDIYLKIIFRIGFLSLLEQANCISATSTLLGTKWSP